LDERDMDSRERRGKSNNNSDSRENNEEVEEEEHEADIPLASLSVFPVGCLSGLLNETSEKEDHLKKCSSN